MQLHCRSNGYPLSCPIPCIVCAAAATPTQYTYTCILFAPEIPLILKLTKSYKNDFYGSRARCCWCSAFTLWRRSVINFVQQNFRRKTIEKLHAACMSERRGTKIVGFQLKWENTFSNDRNEVQLCNEGRTDSEMVNGKFVFLGQRNGQGID